MPAPREDPRAELEEIQLKTNQVVDDVSFLLACLMIFFTKINPQNNCL